MTPAKKIGFSTLAVFLAVAFIELFLALVNTVFPLDQRLLLPRFGGEAAYFFQLDGLPQEDPNHDPLLGWRNASKPNAVINENGWRHAGPFPQKTAKKRIAFVGDSFVYGAGVQDDETLPHFLEKRLGNQYEVLNFGVLGYGIDQIALTATHIVPEYQPDLLVVGFITDDLDRSCTDFSFNLRKPYFEMTDTGTLALRGLPAKTRRAVYLENQTALRKLKGLALSGLHSSKIYALGAQLPLSLKRKHCRSVLGPALLALIKTQWEIPTLFVHLDGNIPSGFEDGMQRLGVPFTSLARSYPELARQMGLAPERQADGHPRASLNQVYAEGISRSLIPKLATTNAKNPGSQRLPGFLTN